MPYRLSQPGNPFSTILKKIYLFTHETQRERGSDIVGGRSRLPIGSLMWDWILELQDHALSQRQTPYRWATRTSRKSILKWKDRSVTKWPCDWFLWPAGGVARVSWGPIPLLLVTAIKNPSRNTLDYPRLNNEDNLTTLNHSWATYVGYWVQNLEQNVLVENIFS